MTALRNVIQALRVLPRRVRLRWALLVPFGVLFALVEAVAAGAVFTLVAVLQDPTQAAELPVLARADAWLPVSWRSGSSLIGLTLCLAVGLFLLRNLLVFAMVLYNSRILAQDRAWLAARFFRGYLLLPYAFHLQRNPTECVRRVNDSVGTLFDVILTHASSVIRNFMSTVGILVILFAAAPTVTLLVGVAVGGWSLALARLMRGMARSIGRGAAEAARRRNQLLHDAFGALRELKVMGREGWFGDRFDEIEQAIIGYRRRNEVMSVLPRLLNEGVLMVTMGVAAAWILSAGPRPTTAMPLLALYVYAGLRLLPSANSMVDSTNQIHYANQALEWLLEDQRSMARHRRPSDGSAGEVITFEHTLALEGISYTYEGASTPALVDVTLRISRGDSIVIVGPTGAGKSTLLDVVAGLLEPAAGSVTVDGIDIRQQRGAWCRLLGYVPQAAYLIDASLRQNIALAVAEAEIDDERVRTVVHAAQLDAVVARLPDGIDTEIGPRGARLSGGERQRVAIARALYAAPQVLLLDEATSALDNETVRAVLDGIHRLRDGTTVVLIAHRVSSVRNRDRLVLLDGGRVEAIGSYDELLATSSQFRELLDVEQRLA